MNSPVKNKVLRTCISFLFVVYLLALIKLVLIKQPGELKTHFIDEYNLALLKTNISGGNYIPFSTVKYYITGTDKSKYSKENLFGNIALFLPCGIFLPLLFGKMRHFQNLLFTSFLISLSFEFVQLITVLGTFDVDDIILNVFGTAIGYTLYKLLAASLSRKKTQISE